jgi:hypothetical protein
LHLMSSEENFLPVLIPEFSIGIIVLFAMQNLVLRTPSHAERECTMDEKSQTNRKPPHRPSEVLIDPCNVTSSTSELARELRTIERGIYLTVIQPKGENHQRVPSTHASRCFALPGKEGNHSQISRLFQMRGQEQQASEITATRVITKSSRRS